MAKLNQQRFLIMTALAGGPRHGYGLVEETVDLTDGQVRPRAGALYHALEKLADSGLIEVEREETVEGRLRRYYRITGQGREALAAEAELQRASADHALRRLGRLA